MPIRKPNKSYKDLRAVIAEHSGLLDGADADSKPFQKLKTASLELKPETASPKTLDVPLTSDTPDHPSQEQTPDIRAQYAKSAVAQDEHSEVIRITMRPPKRGLSKEYDDIVDFANETTALKTILTRALAFVSGHENMILDRKTPFYDSGPGEPFRSRRVVKMTILSAIRSEYDPLDILTDHAFGQTVTDVIVSTYFARKISQQ